MPSPGTSGRISRTRSSGSISEVRAQSTSSARWPDSCSAISLTIAMESAGCHGAIAVRKQEEFRRATPQRALVDLGQPGVHACRIGVKRGLVSASCTSTDLDRQGCRDQAAAAARRLAACAAPNISDSRPCAVRRSIIICHRRSCAWAKPRPKNTSSSLAPKICGTLALSRTISTGAPDPRHLMRRAVIGQRARGEPIDQEPRSEAPERQVRDSPAKASERSLPYLLAVDRRFDRVKLGCASKTNHQREESHGKRRVSWVWGSWAIRWRVIWQKPGHDVTVYQPHRRQGRRLGQANMADRRRKPRPRPPRALIS